MLPTRPTYHHGDLRNSPHPRGADAGRRARRRRASRCAAPPARSASHRAPATGTSPIARRCSRPSRTRAWTRWPRQRTGAGPEANWKTAQFGGNRRAAVLRAAVSIPYVPRYAPERGAASSSPPRVAQRRWGPGRGWRGRTAEAAAVWLRRRPRGSLPERFRAATDTSRPPTPARTPPRAGVAVPARSVPAARARGSPRWSPRPIPGLNRRSAQFARHRPRAAACAAPGGSLTFSMHRARSSLSPPPRVQRPALRGLRGTRGACRRRPPARCLVFRGETDISYHPTAETGSHEPFRVTSGTPDRFAEVDLLADCDDDHARRRRARRRRLRAARRRARCRRS